MNPIEVEQAVEVAPGKFELAAGTVTRLGAGLYSVSSTESESPQPATPVHSPITVILSSVVDASQRIVFGARGDGWYVQSLDGWDELAGRKGRPQSFALRHGGAVVGQDLRESLSGTLRVRFRGTAAQVAAANADILGLAAGRLRLSVTDHDDVTRERDVVVEEVQVANRHFPDSIVTASIVWMAPDPRRYEPARGISAGQVAHNAGTAPTSPVFLVSGPVASGVTITESLTGSQVRFVGAVPAGSELRLDPALGMASLGGRPVMGLRQMQWPLIPPGESRVYTASAGALTVEHRSAWW